MSETLDERWMARALKLAERGVGTTHPNPRVGAVVVANGVAVGEGWHERPGGPHAEVAALAQAGRLARGATLYVTLEPCNARGRTPPCTAAIMRAGVARVVYASADPHPRMGGGADALRRYGVEVVGGVLAEKADPLNEIFFHYVRHGRPHVILKAAISLDGKLATHLRDSRWITGKPARRHVHRLRAASDAILIGAGTLQADNPSLTVRHTRQKGDPPLRAVISLGVPRFDPESRLLTDDAPSRIYVRGGRPEAAEAWRRAGVEVVSVTSLVEALSHLGGDGRLALFVEGGGELHASFLEAQLADELVLYQAPILIGGREAHGFWHGQGVARISEAVRLEEIRRRKLGDDYLIRGRLRYPAE